MKKTLVTLALLFVCGIAGASPATFADANPATPENAAAAPLVPLSDLFGVSVIDQPAECVTGKAKATSGLSAELCGPCSHPACVGQPVVLHVCGSQGSQWLRCHDMGNFCPSDGSVRCGCNNGIIP